jgi:hypothetical protein
LDAQTFQITILNWEKYQPPLANGNRRHWVALSTHILHDPQFFRLTVTDRYLWLMLLCHAGAVGPTFKLSPSDARLLFKLRSNPDFQTLCDQGFINSIHTDRHDKHTNRQTRAEKPTEKPLPDGLNHEAWDMWIAHRKSLRVRAYTTNQKASQLAKLTTEQQAACINHSISNNYQGLFPEKFVEVKGNGAWTLRRANFEAKQYNQIRRSGEAESVFIERIKGVVENFGQ